MSQIRKIAGPRPDQNGVIILPTTFTSDRSPRWSQWREIPKPTRRGRKKIQDRVDIAAAKEAITDSRTNGTTSWEIVKAGLI